MSLFALRETDSGRDSHSETPPLVVSKCFWKTSEAPRCIVQYWNPDYSIEANFSTS